MQLPLELPDKAWVSQTLKLHVLPWHATLVPKHLTLMQAIEKTSVFNVYIVFEKL
jgi:hypothetical protein